jgi:hypothetical protein
LLLLLAGSLIIVGAATKGWWFAPFVVGVLAGLANWIGAWRLRVAVPALAIMAAVGWGAPLVWAVIRGQPYVAMARVIAGILGLPTSAVVGFGLTVLVAVAQALAGYWLGRALTPRPAPELAAEPGYADGRRYAGRTRHSPVCRDSDMDEITWPFDEARQLGCGLVTEHRARSSAQHSCPQQPEPGRPASERCINAWMQPLPSAIPKVRRDHASGQAGGCCLLLGYDAALQLGQFE